MNPQDRNMPDPLTLLSGPVTLRQWLQYYQNVWRQSLAARLVDVQIDTAAKAKNADEMVPDDNSSAFRQLPNIPIKFRLEQRKLKVQMNLDLLAAIEVLLGLSDEELANTYSPEALEIADDVRKPAGLVSYIVQPGKTIIDEAGVTLTATAEDDEPAIIELDPKDEQVKGWLADGSIKPANPDPADQGAPAAEKPAPEAPADSTGSTVNYTVQPGAQFTDGATTYTEGQTFDADNTRADVIAAVQAGTLALTVAANGK